MDLKKKILEAYGRNRGYAHGFASPHAPSLGGRREREDDEGWDREPQHKPAADVPHAVHINGKKWKTFGSQSHATNVAKKIAGATVHKEEVDLEEGTFKYHMDKAIAANTRGDMKKKQYHLDNARTAKFAMKTADYAKNKELLDKHKEMSEEVVAEAAQGHTIEAQGIRGMKATPWRKTFKSHEHLTKWADANDSVEVHATRDLDQVKKGKVAKQGVSEEAKIVHTRTGANGTKYHIRQDSANDYSLHREVDGKLKHVDTYGSLQRAKSVLDNEVKEAVHRIGLTVTDPNHPMVSKRKETIQKTVRVTGDDREKAINTAIAHHKRKGYKVHDHHYIGTVNEDVEQIDEVGDTAKGQKLLQRVNKRAVDRVTSKRADTDPAYAKKAQQTHLAANERLKEESDVYAKSEENKRSADAAKKQGNMFDHHMHMADYHDNLAQWNSERGRHSVADTHAAKSDEHHKQAMKLKEDTNMDTRIWEAWGMGKRDPQKGIKVGHQVRSYDFPGMHDDHYIEGHVVGETPHTYHIRTNRVVRGGKEVPVPAHMSHIEAPKGKGMFSDAYAVHKIVAKQDAVAAKPEAPKGGAKTFANLRGKR